MTAPIYDPLARFENAQIGNISDLVNYSVDFYRVTIVKLVNDLIIDCESNGLETIPVETLRIIASYVAKLPAAIVEEKRS